MENSIIKKATLLLLVFLIGKSITAQDLEGLLDQSIPDAPQPVLATFKSGRVINFHTNELVAPKNLEFRISHRFGPVSGGAYELWGLDQSTIRIGFDYGITDRFMVGIGRSSYQKTYDGFLKYAFIKQMTYGAPISIVGVTSISLNSLRWADPNRDNFFSSRLTYVSELVIARKFSENLSLEIIPTWVHYNLVSTPQDQNDIPVMGVGGRYKVTKRMSINAEYGYRIYTKSNPPNLDRYKNTFSAGIDLETGGHVFQFQFTNSLPMVEKGFLTETTDSWLKGQIHLGFNITREFATGKSKQPKPGH